MWVTQINRAASRWGRPAPHPTTSPCSGQSVPDSAIFHNRPYAISQASDFVQCSQITSGCAIGFVVATQDVVLTMPDLERLPTGLDPVTAGRFGLWLLGKRAQHRAAKRRLTPSRVYGSALVARFAALTMPWTVEEYPGYRRFAAALCGVAVATADRWLYGNRRLPAKHARTLAALCRTKAEQYAALAADFEAHAEAWAEAGDPTKGAAKRQRERRREMIG